MENLTIIEQRDLKKYETIIEKGLTSFIDVGNALLKIRDENLYRESFKTFETYIQKRWGIQRSRAYQLMDGAKVVRHLSTIVDILPINEAQVRPLTLLHPDEQIKVWQKVIDIKPDGGITEKFIEKIIDQIQYNEKLESAKWVDVPNTEECTLLVGDIRTFETDEVFDAIITDPPYPKEYVPLWSDLASFAKRHLKVGGVLLAMTPAPYLPEVISMLGEFLTYQWILACTLPGQHGSVIQSGVRNVMWKPILVYRNGGEPVNIGSDLFENDKRDKDFHEWGQGLGGYLWQIKNFTKPNDLICDPFLGGGTTALASLQLNRRFVGFDADEEKVLISKARINEFKKISST